MSKRNRPLLWSLVIISGLFTLMSITVARADDSEKDQTVLYWYDPMKPGIHFDQPGKSPFMDMDLVPRYAGALEGEGVMIDPAQVQNLGLKTQRVKRGQLTFSRTLAANVDFNGYQKARVQPRAEGFVSSINSLALGDSIEANELIAEITVPAWASDQSEYLLLKRQGAERKIIDGVREKMRLSGMPEEMLALVDSSGKVQTDLKIISPIKGVITELDVYPGMNVEKNMILAEIQGLDPVWVTAEVPESELHLISGANPRVESRAWPNRVFEVLSFTLLPKASQETRTVPLRIVVDNPKSELRPGLSASVRIKNQGPEALLIPTQSLIDLGDETRVITRAEDGSFIPKKVVVGASSRDQTAILDGLAEDDLVVVSGQFLIDSEANLRGALDRMRQQPEPLNSSQNPETEKKAH